MVTVSLLAQPLLDGSRFSLTPFVIHMHHFATKDTPDTRRQTSMHQYLKQISYVFPVPHHLSFHRDLRDALWIFGTGERQQRAEWTNPQPVQVFSPSLTSAEADRAITHAFGHAGFFALKQ